MVLVSGVGSARSTAERRRWCREGSRRSLLPVPCRPDLRRSNLLARARAPRTPRNDMIQVYDNDPGRLLGELTEAQLRFLVDHLEETEPEDRDYYVDRATIEMLEEEGGDAALVASLRGWLAAREGMEIRWEGPEDEDAL